MEPFLYIQVSRLIISSSNCIISLSKKSCKTFQNSDFYCKIIWNVKMNKVICITMLWYPFIDLWPLFTVLNTTPRTNGTFLSSYRTILLFPNIYHKLEINGRREPNIFSISFYTSIVRDIIRQAMQATMMWLYLEKRFGIICRSCSYGFVGIWHILMIITFGIYIWVVKTPL